MRKYVDAELNQEDDDKINMHLGAIKELLPFIINLTIDQRRKLPKMNHRRKPFVEKVLYYASNDQSLIPPHIDVEVHIPSFRARLAIFSFGFACRFFCAIALMGFDDLINFPVMPVSVHKT